MYTLKTLLLTKVRTTLRSSSLLRIHSMNGSGLYTLPPESRPGLRASEPLTGFEEEYKRNKFDFKNVKLVYLFVMMTKLLFQTPKLFMYILLIKIGLLDLRVMSWSLA